ncbi:MAG: hypothetical protein JKY94_01030 [Rhodobacteraceae bacterium]|nr:hypothetical protein [Paracoccaceae bacterium]
MILKLDHWIFGSGYGMGTPLWDGQFYWLVDTFRQSRSSANGQMYWWSGWLGAQLKSTQWRHPKAGERRQLFERDFIVYDSRRSWFRVIVSWSLAGLPDDIEKAHQVLRRLQWELAGSPRGFRRASLDGGKEQ